MPVESMLPALRQRLADWYAGEARILPWRMPPGSAARPDPYHVLVSEVMLQQTTVATVRPRFARFIQRWPTLADLAAAPEAEVLAEWVGLGYYRRAHNLIACADAVVRRHGGTLPADVAALKALPGLGDYTANAIAAIAFGDDSAVPLDANIVRVVTRLFAIEQPPNAALARVRADASALWPATGGGDFAQALMDLGATICTARTPRCGLCPIEACCDAAARGIAADLPVRAPRRTRPHRHGRCWWIERDGAAEREVLLVRRPRGGPLGGMMALPGTAWGDAALPPAPGDRPSGTVHHIFTHFSLDLAVDRRDEPDAMSAESGSAESGEWWPISRLDAAGLPTLYRRAASRALGE